MKIASSRRSKVISEVMGDAMPFVWVSDTWSAQLVAKTKQRQLCLAHQLRDLQYAIDADGSAWAWRMQRLFRRAIRLGKQRDAMTAEHFALAVQQVEERFEHLLKQRTGGPEGQRLRDCYRLHRQSLFVFLHVPGLPPTTMPLNGRCATRSFIAKSLAASVRNGGANAHAIVASVIDTARKQGEDVFEVLLALLAPKAPVVGICSA